MTNINTVDIFQLSQNALQWEPHLIEGEESGQVALLRQTEEERGMVVAGLWKHTSGENPNGIPFNVAGSESFHVINGEAELNLENGEILKIEAGNSYSFAAGFSGNWKTITPFSKFFVIN
jgi:uncharacterized cupin superfamily protein